MDSITRIPRIGLDKDTVHDLATIQCNACNSMYSRSYHEEHDHYYQP